MQKQNASSRLCFVLYEMACLCLWLTKISSSNVPSRYNTGNLEIFCRLLTRQNEHKWDYCIRWELHFTLTIMRSPEQKHWRRRLSWPRRRTNKHTFPAMQYCTWYLPVVVVCKDLLRFRFFSFVWSSLFFFLINGGYIEKRKFPSDWACPFLKRCPK
jgi:hypothetical protein